MTIGIIKEELILPLRELGLVEVQEYYQRKN